MIIYTNSPYVSLIASAQQQTPDNDMVYAAYVARLRNLLYW